MKSVSSAVPSPVGNLRLVPQRGKTDADGELKVSWTPGDGDVDMYAVSLTTTVRCDFWSFPQTPPYEFMTADINVYLFFIPLYMFPFF